MKEKCETNIYSQRILLEKEAQNLYCIGCVRLHWISDGSTTLEKMYKFSTTVIQKYFKCFYIKSKQNVSEITLMIFQSYLPCKQSQKAKIPLNILITKWIDSKRLISEINFLFQLLQPTFKV